MIAKAKKIGGLVLALLITFCAIMPVFGAEFKDDNVYCLLTSLRYWNGEAYVTVDSDNITQYNGVWHFPHTQEFGNSFSNVQITFEILNVNKIDNLSFDFILLNKSTQSFGPGDESIVFTFDDIIERYLFRSVPVTFHIEKLRLENKNFKVAFAYNYNSPNNLMFTFDNFVVNDKETIIISQNDEIINQLKDTNDQLEEIKNMEGEKSLPEMEIGEFEAIPIATLTPEMKIEISDNPFIACINGFTNLFNGQPYFAMFLALCLISVALPVVIHWVKRK